MGEDLSVGVRVRVRVLVVGVHRTLVRAEAQDVRGQVLGGDAVAVGGCSDVLACQIRVMLHRRGV